MVAYFYIKYYKSFKRSYLLYKKESFMIVNVPIIIKIIVFVVIINILNIVFVNELSVRLNILGFLLSFKLQRYINILVKKLGNQYVSAMIVTGWLN